MSNHVYFRLFVIETVVSLNYLFKTQMDILNTPKTLSAAIIALLSLMDVAELQAQTSSAQEIQVTNNASNPTNNTLRAFNLSTIGLKGTPLALPNWAPGELTLDGSQPVTAGLFNYDIYSKLVTVKRSPRDSVVYAIASVKQLILKPNGVAPLRYEHVPGLITDEAALKTDLLRIIHQGTYSLVEFPVKQYIKAPAKQTYGGMGEVSNEFRDESVYYLIRPDHTTERVKLSKKSLTKALKDKGAAFESFVKANSIDFDKEADVAKALAALN
ncbi:hypothetical protein [Fibrella forsythiae]|uniref:Uncharacterized protein n=1 Tax=Fibrella forsythiae TaxID=2817061 RepID=A0ABS3JKN4_9BACT|nr:hypothetical protein [Fibrella forsythiae]MBO0950555.1 hypothetical protein [Fibrella forsythiae]